jgi:hypothetical protein
MLRIVRLGPSISPNWGDSLGNTWPACGFAAQADLYRAHRDRRAELDGALADHRAPDARVIGRAEVAYHDAFRLALDHAVMSRHGVVGQDQVVVLRLADPELFTERLARTAGCAAQHDDDHVGRQLAAGRLRLGPDLRRGLRHSEL